MTHLQHLLEAIVDGDVATVTALIASGIDVNVGHDSHLPPLFQAIEHQRVDIARRLIDAGADVNWDSGNGWTPLVHAIDIESDSAWQAHHETGHESTDLSVMLLAAGAVPTRTAFDIAAEYANSKALMLLEQAGRV